MSGQKKKPRIKSEAERQAYKQALAHPNFAPATTAESYGDSLHGSNEVYVADGPYSSTQEKSVPTPINIKVSRWIKDNGLTLLLATILIGVLSWLLINTIDLKVTVAEINVKIEYLESDIEEISDDYISKEKLESELQLISKDVDNISIFNVSALEKKVEELESQIKELRDKE